MSGPKLITDLTQLGGFTGGYLIPVADPSTLFGAAWSITKAA